MRFAVPVALLALAALPALGGVGAMTDCRGAVLVGVALVGVDTLGLLPGVELRDAVPLLILLALDPDPAFASVPGRVLVGFGLRTLTWLGRTKTPKFGRHSKYTSPCTEPLFLPAGASLRLARRCSASAYSSMPIHRPALKAGLTPVQRT